MFDTEIKVNKFLLEYCRLLIADIAEERMTEQPMPGVNHPAWILGHLAFSAEMIVGRLGGDKFLPANWADLFKLGSSPCANREDYPSKAELLKTVEDSFALARDMAAAASDETLSTPSPNPRFKEGLPTLRETTALILTGHLGVHLGQLSMWRRMIGLAPLF